MDDRQEVTELWKYYQDGIAYQQALGLTEQIPKNIDFYEGRQWAPPTEKTKNLPRPVINIVKMIVRNKKSGILSGKLSLTFSGTSENEDSSDKITAFNAHIEKEMGMKSLRNKLVDDSVKKGCGIKHYYWDAEAAGLRGEYRGGVRAEIIDPLNVFFANPQETDEQKQKWILIAARVDVAAVKEMAESWVDKTLIAADDYDGTKYNEEQEQNDSDLCTVLVRYFKQNGEVYYERGTKAVMLHKPRPLTPNTKEFSGDDEEDAAETELPDAVDKPIDDYKVTLYPIVVYSYEEREKSIYGLSEIEGIIPNQKAVNFNIAMQLLAVQNQAWGKYIAKEGALKGQKITNVPGETLIDHSPPGIEGIKKMTEQPFSQMPLQLVDTIITSTRTVTGSTEVVTGEQVSANQSGAAIAQLQSQALKPIEELRERYWDACERGGRIVEQFYKLFYEKKQFSRTDGNTTEIDTFNGADYIDTDFAVTVEATAGTQFSESLAIMLLDGLLQNQIIDAMTYIELYPDNAMPFKAKLKNKLQEREASENTQLKAQVTQMQAYLEQAINTIKTNQGTTEQAAALVGTFEQLKQQLNALKIEGATKIIAQNQTIESLMAKNAETTQDAQALAVMAAQAQGATNGNKAVS